MFLHVDDPFCETTSWRFNPEYPVFYLNGKDLSRAIARAIFTGFGPKFARFARCVHTCAPGKL